MKTVYRIIMETDNTGPFWYVEERSLFIFWTYVRDTASCSSADEAEKRYLRGKVKTVIKTVGR